MVRVYTEVVSNCKSAILSNIIIKSFWGYAKHRLYKFKGIPKEKFELYLKETEYRFNHRGQDPLFYS